MAILALLFWQRSPEARSLPQPYDAEAQIQIWTGLLRSEPERYELTAIDLFEPDSAPYAPRANSTMLADLRYLFRTPESAAFQAEGRLLQERSGGDPTFERSLFVHTSFELPGQQSFFFAPRIPLHVRGQVLRIGLWVRSDMYRDRLWLVFRSAGGREVRADAGTLQFRGWRRLDLSPPPELFAESRLMEHPYDHQFLGFLIESSPHSEAGAIAIQLDNLTALVDMQRLRYPGAEYIDGWPQAGRGGSR
ncbi:MAG: hypothetical protein K1X75_05445 [Leptospirales bacterium]|nr:hypothetical protein [Leptospirales bacterium]